MAAKWGFLKLNIRKLKRGGTAPEPRRNLGFRRGWAPIQRLMASREPNSWQRFTSGEEMQKNLEREGLKLTVYNPKTNRVIQPTLQQYNSLISKHK